MCIDYKLSKREWLKDKPNVIIAYKVVCKNCCDDYSSIFGRLEHFSKTSMNKIKGKRDPVHIDRFEEKYRPYYHLFVSKEGARAWRGSDEVILKCEVPKAEIRTVGMQKDKKVIVSKAFRIVEEVL